MNNRLTGFFDKSHGEQSQPVTFDRPVTPAEAHNILAHHGVTAEGKTFISTPLDELHKKTRLRHAKVVIGQCIGTTLGCTLAFNGLANVIDAARGHEEDDSSRWTRAAVGAGKMAAGAAALYYTLVNPPRFMR